MAKQSELRKLALGWWRGKEPHMQQYLANKYHPEDDFIATSKSSVRIERIFLQEATKND